jgi:threonine 3-dehydrogenase
MKAIIKKEPMQGLWMDDIPVPTIENNEVLIKSVKTSICGTDLNIYKWNPWSQKTVPLPLVIGHEFMGVIAKIGSNVKGLKEGDRIAGEGHITCGHCPPCRMGKKHICMNTIGLGYHCNGCFSEYFRFPAENVFLLPDTISDDLAAIFDPYGNAVHTALSADLVGEDVLITGAGPIGIMATAIAKYAGARNIVITDINPYRLDLATKMGATAAVNVSSSNVEEAMQQLGIDHGFTVGMEMSGHPQGLTTLLKTAQHGAHISLLGILPPDCPIDWDLIIFKMLRLKGIYGREIFSTWYKMTHMIEGGLDLSPIITHHFPVDDFEKGFQTMLSGNCGKVILDW